jgi:enoyl-CoA hydratase/carnithine racemase
MSHRYIRLELNEASQQATLVLDHAPGNLLGIAVIEEINHALMSLRQARIEVLVIRGANRTFSEGFDLTEHVPQRVRRLIQLFFRFFEMIRMMDVISIAAVEGKAWGAGFELALGCNLIAASESSSFALPQLTQGLIPPVATAILPRIAPRRRAMEWILTARELSAQTLAHDGIVNRVLPDATFDDGLAAFVNDITNKSGPVLQLAKRAQFESYYSSFTDALMSIQSLYLHELLGLDDSREGQTAAREGREPIWKDA